MNAREEIVEIMARTMAGNWNRPGLYSALAALESSGYTVARLDKVGVLYRDGEFLSRPIRSDEQSPEPLFRIVQVDDQEDAP